jgi:hypothetical protein
VKLGKKASDICAALSKAHGGEAVKKSSVLEWLQAGQLDFGGLIPHGELGMFLFITSRPALGPIQSPIQWILGTLSPGVKLTTHIHLVPKSRMHGTIPPPPSMSSWHGASLSMWTTLPSKHCKECHKI